MATAAMTVVQCPKCGAKNRVNERAAETHRPKCGRCGTYLASRAAQGADGATSGHDGHPTELTDATIEPFLRAAGDKPVLVDCWAAWCGPCRMLAPTIDALAAESRGRWHIAKLDTDANPRTAAHYRISSIPALLIFKRGQLVDQLVGVQPKNAIIARLTQHE